MTSQNRGRAFPCRRGAERSDAASRRKIAAICRCLPQMPYAERYEVIIAKRGKCLRERGYRRIRYKHRCRAYIPVPARRRWTRCACSRKCVRVCCAGRVRNIASANTRRCAATHKEPTAPTKRFFRHHHTIVSFAAPPRQLPGCFRPPYRSPNTATPPTRQMTAGGDGYDVVATRCCSLPSDTFFMPLR